MVDYNGIFVRLQICFLGKERYVPILFVATVRLTDTPPCED